MSSWGSWRRAAAASSARTGRTTCSPSPSPPCSAASRKQTGRSSTPEPCPMHATVPGMNWRLRCGNCASSGRAKPSDFNLSTAESIIRSFDQGGIDRPRDDRAGRGEPAHRRHRHRHVMIIGVTERTREIGIRRRAPERAAAKCCSSSCSNALLSTVGGLVGDCSGRDHRIGGGPRRSGVLRRAARRAWRVSAGVLTAAVVGDRRLPAGTPRRAPRPGRSAALRIGPAGRVGGGMTAPTAPPSRGPTTRTIP